MKIAIIPARGGSKRIPLKNIREFAGKPMITHSIECAKRSKLFDKIIVSTDDKKIANIAVEYGAEVPFIRPEELSDDHCATTPVIAHAIRWLQNNGITPELVCCIYATAPFLNEKDLKEGLDLMESADWQYVFSATNFAFPIFRAFKQINDGGVEMFYPEHFQTRSQDLPEALHDAGQFYWGKPAAWLEGKRIFDKHSKPVVIPRWRVQDIDTEDDWVRAEILAPIVMGHGE